jgi:predicted DNA-binding ribbon-helix-helix protein
MTQEQQNREPVVVERVQTGVRMEKRLLKVLKAVAELKEMTLGDLLEGIVLHAFEGKLVPFSPQDAEGD